MPPSNPRKPNPKPRKPPTPDARPSVVDQLRRALREETADRRRSAYSIAKEAGIERIQISRFLDGGDLKGESLSKLCRALGLELRPRGRAARVA